MHLESALREGGARLSLSPREGKLRNVFILAQAAVTVMLLVLASLLVLSYRAMMSAEIGFANRDAVVYEFAIARPGFVWSAGLRSRNSGARSITQLLDRLREAPWR